MSNTTDIIDICQFASLLGVSEKTARRNLKKWPHARIGRKINSRVENLEWATGRENIGHAIAMGLMKIAKLNDDQVRSVFAMRASGMKPGKIARSLGVHYNTVYLILKRKIWCHVASEAA